MNHYMKDALHGCIEIDLQKYEGVEFVVPKLKSVWPEAHSRNDLLRRIAIFAADNGWHVEIFDSRFRVCFAKHA